MPQFNFQKKSTEGNKLIYLHLNSRRGEHVKNDGNTDALVQVNNIQELIQVYFPPPVEFTSGWFTMVTEKDNIKMEPVDLFVPLF